MNKYTIATATIAALLTATPAFADSHGSDHKGFLNLGNLTNTAAIQVGTDTEGADDGHEGIGAQVRVMAHDQDNASSSHGLGSFVSALAHAFRRDNDNDKDDHKATTTPATTTPSTVDVNIVGTVSAVNGTTITLSGKNGATYTVNAGSASITGGGETRVLADIKTGDTLAVHGTLDGSVVTASRIVDKAYAKHLLSSIDSLRAGIVTAISSTGLTLQPFGSTSTTSVTTTGSTTVYTKGGATTTNAIATGTNVLAFGTTSTSTPNTFVASVIVVLGQGLQYLKDIFLMR